MLGIFYVAEQLFISEEWSNLIELVITLHNSLRDWPQCGFQSFILDVLYMKKRLRQNERNKRKMELTY